MDKATLAKEAERLSREPALVEAMRLMREEAVEALIKAPADNTTAILWLQAKCAIIDEFQGQLASFIQDGTPLPERPGFA